MSYALKKFNMNGMEMQGKNCKNHKSTKLILKKTMKNGERMENQKENTPIDNTELWNREPVRIQHTRIAPSAASQSHKRLGIGTKLLLAFAAIAGLIFLWFVSVVFIRLHNRAKYRDSYYVQVVKLQF